MKRPICIGCGCDEQHACPMDHVGFYAGCWWVRFDAASRTGTVAGGQFFNLKDIKTLDGRYRCLVKIRGYLITAVLCHTRLSPSREYIEIGGFYTDQVMRGWFPIGELEVIEILAKVAIYDDKPKPRRRSWQFWKR